MPKRTDIQSILLIGAGPIIIGQACEFDYSGTQALKALKEEGYRVILVNSNPATIMTDPGFADRTYIEPITTDIFNAGQTGGFELRRALGPHAFEKLHRSRKSAQAVTHTGLRTNCDGFTIRSLGRRLHGRP